jgi:WD40 repeat protein
MHYMSLTQALFVGQTTGLVYVLKPQEKKLQRAFQAHHNAVMGLGSHPTDLEGWSTGRDGLFLYWDLERAEPFGHLLVSEAGLRGFVPLPKQRLFACLGRDGSLHIVDRDTRSVQRKMVIEERPLFSIAMSLDEKQLWVGTHAGRIYSWDTGTWTLHQVIEAHTRATNALRVDPTGRYLASAGRDRLVHIWGTATGRKCLTLSGHSRSVNALAWIDESTLASGGDDGLVKIWHLEV